MDAKTLIDLALPQDRSREHLLWSQHKGGFLKRTKLPSRTSAATGELDYDYTVDVEVSGGRVKTYGKVNLTEVVGLTEEEVDQEVGKKKKDDGKGAQGKVTPVAQGKGKGKR